MLLVITNDLMAAAPIEHTARQLNAACRVTRLDQAIDIGPTEPVDLVVLDLNAVDQVVDAVEQLRATIDSKVPIVAFGPHVHDQKLDAARDAGCARVLTRGQFHQQGRNVIAAVLANTR